MLEQYKNELLFNKEKNQGSNSGSQLSTKSDEEHNIINNININNNNIYNSSLLKNKIIKKEKKLNLEESIKKEIKYISSQFNSNPFQQCPLTLACHYHCNLLLNEEEEYNLNLEIKDTIEDYKKKMKNERKK